MQVKDITDEMIYSAIRAKNKYNAEQWERRIPGYSKATLLEKIKVSAMALGDPKAPKNKLVTAFIDAPEKLVYRKMEKMVDQGKLDYGTSLRTAWIVGENDEG